MHSMFTLAALCQSATEENTKNAVFLMF